ncbi:unnamed protein product [Brassica oleracea]
MSKSYRFIPVHEGDLEPLFVTRKRTGGVIAFRVFAASVFGLQSVRWNPFWRFTFADTLSQRYGNDLPRLDVFVCTADPVIEPPSMVVNTVLSVLALDYPPEKLAVYLSDDGGSHQLTFYALSRKQLSLLIHGFRFVRSSTWSRDLQLLTCLPRQTWVSFLCLWQLRVSWKISGGRFILNLDWDMYSNNSKSARDALCILLDEKEGKDIAFVQFPQFYDNLTRNGSMMSVVVAHVRWSSMDWMERADRFTLGLAAFTDRRDMGVKYGCPVEDIIIGLSIQCRGWKSAYLTPKKKAFLGVAPTNLHQMLGQQRRDGQRVSSWWFILFGYVAAAANAYSLAVFLWCEKKYT